MDGQIFEICDLGRSMSFTYREIKDDIEQCIAKVIWLGKKRIEGKLLKDFHKGEYSDVVYEPVEYGEGELEELRGYMREFLVDVENEYVGKN
jgi:hypothetical protein